MKRKDKLNEIRIKLEKKGYFHHGGGMYKGNHFPRGIVRRETKFKKAFYVGMDWFKAEKYHFGG